MDIALEKASETNASLLITPNPDDYKAEVDKKLKQYSKTVALKGFRPGHVPPALVKKMYGKGILIEEINSILSQTVSNYIRDNKLQVVGDPVPNREKADAIDWDNQEQFKFSYELGLASDFEVHFDQLTALTKYDIQVTDKEIEETIQNLQKQFHTHEHAEEVADGDTIYGELKQVNAPEGDAPQFASKTAFPTNKMTDEGKAAFIGKGKGELISFTLEAVFPDEKDRANATGVKKEEAADLTGEFTFQIEDITRHQPSEINQELFDKTFGVGQVQDEEQFRAKIQEVIVGNYERESSTLLRYDIERELLNIPILLPEEFLKNWLLETNEGKVTREQIDAEFEDFTKSVKLQLIKNKIAEQGDVKVEFEEIMEATRQMVRQQFGFSNTDDEEMNKTIDKIARDYLMNDKNNGEAYRSMFNRVFDDRVIDYAKSQVTVEPKSVSFDEFKAIAEAQQ